MQHLNLRFIHLRRLDCMYINGSGRDYYEFYIQLNRCGTLGKNSLHEDNRKNPTVRTFFDDLILC